NNPHDFCPYCKKPMTHYHWCQPCESAQLRENFGNWTSGNIEINQFIQETQLSSTSPKRSSHNLVFLIVHDLKTAVEEFIYQESVGMGDHKNQKQRHSYQSQISKDLQFLFNSGFVTTALGTSSFCVKNNQTIAFGYFMIVIDESNIKPNKRRFYYPKYIAPESLENHIFTKESNIYSFGLIMYDLLSPFIKELDLYNARNYISKMEMFYKKSNLEFVPESAPKSYVVLMNQCLNHDPKLRLSIMEIINTLGEWYLEMEQNIDTQIVIEFRIADKFLQAFHMRFNKKLKPDSGVIALTGEDISTKSRLSAIRELGVDLIDINQFTDRKCIREGGFGCVKKALWK
ncbi:19253_t:CDS:2, partial [Dentiscutata erythropus]